MTDSDKDLTISVVGLGYIGLPTAAVLASKNIDVIGVDRNVDLVTRLIAGNIPSVEPGLSSLVSTTIKNNTLRVSTTYERADVFIIAVPTPFKALHEPDLSYVEASVTSIANVLEKGNLVILESTCPVGTTEKVVEWMSKQRPDLVFPSLGGEDGYFDVAVAYCPERVLPGHILQELSSNGRLIGGMTNFCAARARDIYKRFVDADCVVTDCRTAELSKLVENSFRDVNIAFANELSVIADAFGVDVWELIKLSNRHPRVNILEPGPGVGGHCIAVDPWFIVSALPNHTKLIRTARLVNDEKPDFVISKIEEAKDAIANDISTPNIACLGLTFKSNVSDLRQSPALEIAQRLVSMKFGNIFIVEPHISELPASLDMETVSLVDLKTAFEESDIVLLLVDHSQFHQIDVDILKDKYVIDTRGCWDTN